MVSLLVNKFFVHFTDSYEDWNIESGRMFDYYKELFFDNCTRR
jgi:hypothetical protein